ncbi:MAG: response regulator [Armatimonadota bacterium]
MSRVLVVDDDQSIREVLVHSLEDAEFDTHAVASGREALKALCAASAEDSPYDAMILDIVMPDVDGWDVLEAVKANPLWREMPIVVVSGHVNGASDVARVSSYDGFFVEKSGNFVEIIKSALGRILQAA